VFFVLLAPTLVHGMVCFLRVKNSGFDGFLKSFWPFLAVFVLGTALIALSCVFLVHWIDGVVAASSMLLLAYVGWQTYLYIKNDFRMSPVMLMINRILAIALVLVGSVYSFLEDDLSRYVGVTYSMCALLMLLWLYAIFQFVRDFAEKDRRPVYYSASLLPIYKFNPITNDVEPHYGPTLAWTFGLFLLLLWGFVTNIQLTPKWFGAVITIGIEIIVVMSTVYIRALTLEAVYDAYDFMNEAIAKRAWLETKQSYVKSLGCYSRQDMQTYRRMWKQRFYLGSYLAVLKGEKPPKTPHINDKLMQEIDFAKDGQVYDGEAFYRAKVLKFLPANLYNIDSIADLECAFFRQDLLAR